MRLVRLLGSGSGLMGRLLYRALAAEKMAGRLMPVAALVCFSLSACDKSPAAPTQTIPEGGGPAGSGLVVLNEDLRGSRLYPPNNWWNRDISRAPVDPRSAEFIEWLDDARLHPDFGPPPYGLPYVTVEGTQPRVPVTFVAFGDESDAGAPGEPPGYPIPDEARTRANFIEGGVPGGGDSGDRHLLLLDRDRLLLFETWATRWNTATSRWEAGSGAVFDLTTNRRRPEGWTSADAAGLAILPGLVRYDEVVGAAEINHAFRATVRATNGHVWPASHTAGSNPNAPPMGARFRLRADTDLSGFSGRLQKIFRAMQRYGLIVADNGSSIFVTGTMDSRWNNDELNPAFHSLRAGDFEVIKLGWR